MISELFQKLHLLTYTSQFMTSVDREKITKKLDISRMKRAFQMKKKTYFMNFEMLSFGKIQKRGALNGHQA